MPSPSREIMLWLSDDVIVMTDGSSYKWVHGDYNSCENHRSDWLRYLAQDILYLDTIKTNRSLNATEQRIYDRLRDEFEYYTYYRKYFGREV